MAKKVTINGSNLLSTTQDAWGGKNNTQSSQTIHGTTVPSGAEWGINRGEVERFIKEQIDDTNAYIERTAEEIRGEIGERTIIEGDVTNFPDDEDLTSVEVGNVEVVKFKDKSYSPSNYSGYGRKYLRKNVVQEARRTKQDITELCTRNDGAFMELSSGVDGTASTSSRWSMGYLTYNVSQGDILFLKGTYVSSYGKYFWGILGSNNKILQCGGEASDWHAFNEVVEVEHDGVLVMNIITYSSPPYSVTLLARGETVTINKLSQQQFSQQNTIYIVQYDYDMNLGSITLPANSVLWFQGGSIKHAILNGNNSTIIADKDDNIFGRESNIAGSWNNREWHPMWFGAYADGEHDDTGVLQQMLDLSTTIMSHVDIILYGKVFRTTSSLYIKNETSIFGGTLDAKFENPLQWVLRTYSLYNNTTVTGYRAFAGWQAFDAGIVQQTNGGIIKDLTITGELNDNGDGTYAPVFGGLRIEASNIPTENVTITNVGHGIARSTSLQSSDHNMNVQAYFTAYSALCVNGVSVYDSYLNAHSHYYKSSESDTQKVIPYTEPYQRLISTGAYADGTGGVYDDDELARPKFCSFKGVYSIITFTNCLIDYWCEIAVAVGASSNVTFVCPWWEAVAGCFVFAAVAARVTVVNPNAFSDPTYDLYMGESTNITLIGGGVYCNGHGDANATSHKFYYPRYTQADVYVMDMHRENYPDCDRFHFLSGDYTYKIADDSFASRYSDPSDANFSRNNGASVYKTLYSAFINSRKSFSIPAGTAASCGFGFMTNDDFLEKVFSGASKENSKVGFSSLQRLTFGKENKYTFNNLTIELGGLCSFKNCKVVFYSCDIFISDYYGSSVIGSNGADMEFYDCRIFAVGNAFSECKCLFVDTKAIPVLRFGSGGAKTSFPDKGTTAVKNINSWHYENGFEFYDTTLGRKEHWNLRQWVLDDGFPYIPTIGTDAQLPALPNMKLGSRYYDTTNSVWKTLTANGTCASTTFRFGDNIDYAVSSISFYIGTTQVTPSSGEFSVSIAEGTYPISCDGYECIPNTITITDSNDPLALYLKQSKYTTSYTLTINAKDGDGLALNGLTLVCGGKVLSEGTNGRYTTSLKTGHYTLVASGYEDQTTIDVSSGNVSMNVTFSNASASGQSRTITGTQQSLDDIVNSNGDSITAGTINVLVGDISLDIALTQDDIDMMTYLTNNSNYSLDRIKQYFACHILKAWFADGHYGEYISTNGVGAKLYYDKVGNISGFSGSYTDDGTNVICTQVTSSNGTNATWADDIVSSSD